MIWFLLMRSLMSNIILYYQVWREVEVDCALAELFIKGSLMEEITTNLANHEMFNTVYQRINEVRCTCVLAPIHHLFSHVTQVVGKHRAIQLLLCSSCQF